MGSSKSGHLRQVAWEASQEIKISVYVVIPFDTIINYFWPNLVNF